RGWGARQGRIGKRDVRQRRTATRKLSGQPAGGPRSVVDQSKVRNRPAISLSPGNRRSNSRSFRRAAPLMTHLLRPHAKADRVSGEEKFYPKRYEKAARRQSGRGTQP